MSLEYTLPSSHCSLSIASFLPFNLLLLVVTPVKSPVILSHCCRDIHKLVMIPWILFFFFYLISYLFLPCPLIIHLNSLQQLWNALTLEVGGPSEYALELANDGWIEMVTFLKLQKRSMKWHEGSCFFLKYGIKHGLGY